MLSTNTNCSVVSVQKQVLEVSGNSHVPMFPQPGFQAGTLTSTQLAQMRTLIKCFCDFPYDRGVSRPRGTWLDQLRYTTELCVQVHYRALYVPLSAVCRVYLKRQYFWG